MSFNEGVSFNVSASFNLAMSFKVDMSSNNAIEGPDAPGVGAWDGARDPVTPLNYTIWPEIFEKNREIILLFTNLVFLVKW